MWVREYDDLKAREESVGEEVGLLVEVFVGALVEVEVEVEVEEEEEERWKDGYK